MDLNNQQLQATSDICKDIAQVAIGSIAVPYIVESPNPKLSLFGFIFAIAFWILSLVLLIGRKETI